MVIEFNLLTLNIQFQLLSEIRRSGDFLLGQVRHSFHYFMKFIFPVNKYLFRVLVFPYPAFFMSCVILLLQQHHHFPLS